MADILLQPLDERAEQPLDALVHTAPLLAEAQLKAETPLPPELDPIVAPRVCLQRVAQVVVMMESETSLGALLVQLGKAATEILREARPGRAGRDVLHDDE